MEERPVLTLFLLAVCFLTVCSGLNCYKSNWMNRLDVTKVVEEDECSSNDKSCKSEAYSVGRMWYMKLSCSEDDKDGCTSESQGSGDKFICNCKTDYCNGANSKSISMFGAMAAALMSITYWQNHNF